MAISLLIGYHDTRREDRLISIASDEVFVERWLPVCLELGLRWVSRFGTGGWRLTPDDCAPILKDLERLRDHVSAHVPAADGQSEWLARLSELTRELIALEHTPQAVAFIGSVWQSHNRPAALAPFPQLRTRSGTGSTQQGTVTLTRLSPSWRTSLDDL